MENREMFQEINALVGTLAKAFDVSEMDVINAIEQGRLGLEMTRDDEGRSFLAANLDNRNVRIYQGAIFREGDKVAFDPAGTEDAGECSH